MRDVARLAGVSLKTVSRVVNGEPTVAPELVARTNEAIKTLNYRPNSLAAQLKSGSGLRTIGLVAKNLASEFTSGIIAGVSAVAQRHASHLITVSGQEFDTSQGDWESVGELVDRRVDGIVIMAAGGDYGSFESFSGIGTPMVFVDREPTGLTADVVTVDNEGGAWTLLSQLVDMGHTRIAMLFGNMELATMRNRRSGAIQALRDAGILVSQSPAVYGLMDREAATQATKHLLDRANRPTAFFCANSEILIGVAKALLARDHRATLAAFERSSYVDFLPMETVIFPADGFALGSTAATLLYDRIKDPSTQTKRINVPASIQITPAPSWGSSFGLRQSGTANEE